MNQKQYQEPKKLKNKREEKIKSRKTFLQDFDFKIFADGCSQTNPSETSCGYVVMINDEIVKHDSKRLGYGTNNTAEFNGLLEALKFCKEQAKEDYLYHNLTIFSDSQFMVNSINENYKLQNLVLIGLRDKIYKLIKSFESVKLHWIPRELNIIADELAGNMFKNV